MVVDEALLERGRERYGIYCAVPPRPRATASAPKRCARRPSTRELWGWVDPASRRADNAKAYTNGELFHIVSHGISNMKGYGSQIVPRDRWAIVAYVRALQMTQGINRREESESGRLRASDEKTCGPRPSTSPRDQLHGLRALTDFPARTPDPEALQHPKRQRPCTVPSQIPSAIR